MRKFYTAVLLIVFLSAGISAQSIINPSDSFYEDLKVWETLGLVSNLPPLRPYPEQMVKSILNQVMESSNPVQRERARAQYDRLFYRPVRVAAEGIGTFSMNNHSDTAKQADMSLILFGNYSFRNIFSLAYDLNILLSNKDPGEEITPANSAYPHDTYADSAEIGPMNVYTSFNTAAAVGTEKMWFQAGMNRSSWGDFYDNGLVIGPDAFHTGNMSFVINEKKWNYTLAMFMLSASPDTGNIYDSPHPEKFMFMHAVEFKPLKWLSLSYYENVIYGQRFDPLYLLPVSPYMISQQLTGADDYNLQMGVSFKIKPFSGFSWATNLFLDDANFNDIIRLDFDTKLRIGLQTGVTWIPEVPMVSAVLFDYTLITPYTYTHYDYSEDRVNYQNYTNKGRSIGASIPPNSDRITLTGKFEPIKNLRVNASAVFIRHANVNESLPWDVAKEYLDYTYDPEKSESIDTSGGIMDSPNAGKEYLDYAHDNLMFMEQETKQYTVQLGLDAAWELPRFKYGSLSFTAGYVFEFIYNDGVSNPIYTGSELDLSTNPTEAQIKQAIEKAKSVWRSNLRNTINNYFTLGIKFTY
ncbi:hypothetical protein [Breznakiella homolactica]|uniref:Capsule assembly Wzi family protein n=1 Tax=Breznakiella homolactica TaxID=2798577 RepID=A0A7T7XP10_9SPIR|nr:hypothetical protein [Breznakiella homolactica]QQO09792.1 hypothetical protein JFL75_02465 [Breznakiella homolactica]